MIRRPPRSPLFPYPTLFRSATARVGIRALVAKPVPIHGCSRTTAPKLLQISTLSRVWAPESDWWRTGGSTASAEERSEEHTSELQSRQYLVCRLLLEKKTKN